MIKIGLVVEGPHDLIMLEPLIESEVKKKFGDDVKFVRLQPFPDAIGKFSEGGWSRVVAWCQKYAGDGIDTFFTPLFAGDVACDFVVIHLDGDALELSNHLTSIVVPESSPTPEVRVGLIVQSIGEWLDLNDQFRPKIAFAIPVLQTEAWILAAEQVEQSLEEINSKIEFRKSYKWKQDGAIKLFYQRRVRRAMAGMENISDRCSSYGLFQDSIRRLEI